MLVVGFDAADGEIMLELTRQGRLPALRSVLRQGLRAEVQNPPGLFVGAVWPSFFTGSWPGSHGRYCYTQLQPGTYETQKVRAADVRGEPFWATLARAGHRTAVVDVPHTHVTGRHEGVHIVDWGRHDPNVGFQTWPSELAAHITDRFGSHPVERCDTYARAGAFGDLTRDLLTGIGRKADLVDFLLEQEDWSLFLVVFSESHCVGHACWFLHDREHPRHDVGLAAALGDPVVDVYEALDAALGRLIARVDDETLVLVLLSHGMGPHYDAGFLLDEMLLRIEARDQPFGRVRQLRPELRRFARRAVRSGRRRLGLSPGRRGPFDAARPFFQIPNNDVYAGIRINQVGREPSGRVAPGGEFDRTCDLLAEALATWTNLETGEPLVRRVLRTADLYEGSGTAGMPDLMVEWNRDRPIRSIAAPGCGRIDGQWKGARTGDHRPEGMLFARGPGIDPGSEHGPVRVVDLAPTICAALGTSLIEADGRSLAALTS